MIWGAVIGAGISLIGSSMSRSAQSDAADRAEFQPFNASSQALGTATSRTQGITLHETPEATGQRDFFNQQFSNAAADPAGLGQFGTDTLMTGVNQFPGAFNAAQGASFDMSNQVSGAFGQNIDQLSSQFGVLGGQGVGNAFGAPTNAAGISMANQTAQGFLGQIGNVGAMGDQVTARLDALARPAEQSAVNSKFNTLFGSGQLGTTGGQQDLGQLALAQSQAQDSRSLAGLNFAQTQQAQLGQLGGQFLGLGGQLTQSDQNLALGQGNIGAGLLGQIGSLQQQGLDASVGQDARNIGLQGSRLSNVQDLFGFGQQLQEAPTGQASRALLAQDPLDNRLINMANLSLQGSAIATGGAGIGAQIAGNAGSPFGSALQGFGQGLFNSSGQFSNLFGGNTQNQPLFNSNTGQEIAGPQPGG